MKSMLLKNPTVPVIIQHNREIRAEYPTYKTIVTNPPN